MLKIKGTFSYNKQVMIVCGNMFVNLLPDNKYIKVYMVVLCGLLNYALMKQHT